MHYVEAKSILSAHNGMNIYRGCQHGCIYCDSRSVCYSMDHAFEDIEVKENSISLLEQALRRKRRRCMTGTGSMSDPYMPLEAELGYTRRALELIERYGFGAAVLTKSDLVLRDLELLSAINEKSKAVVQMTMTTYSETLCRIVEPGVCGTKRRFEVLLKLREAGIPTVVWLCPILPYIHDSEENLLGILDYCREAGVYGIVNFGMGLTLRQGSREHYYRMLDRHFPGLKERYIKEYGMAYELPSPNSARLEAIFHDRCEKSGIVHDNGRIFRYLNEIDIHEAEQLSLFE